MDGPITLPLAGIILSIIGLTGLKLLYLLHPLVRRRRCLNMRIRSSERRLRSTVGRLQDIERQSEEILVAEANRGADLAFRDSWIDELGDVSGVGPGIRASLRSAQLPAYPLFTQGDLENIRGIGAGRASAIMAALARRRRVLTSNTLEAIRSGCRPLGAEAASRQKNLEKARSIATGEAKSIERRVAALARLRRRVRAPTFGQFVWGLLRKAPLVAEEQRSSTVTSSVPPSGVRRPSQGDLKLATEGSASIAASAILTRPPTTAHTERPSPSATDAPGRPVARHGFAETVVVTGESPAKTAVPGADKPPELAAALWVLHLSMRVAASDGRIEEDELRKMHSGIQRAFQLSPAGQLAIQKQAETLRRMTPQELAAAPIASTPLRLEHRSRVGRLLLAIAAADGMISEGERILIRDCFERLGLTIADLDRELRRLLPDDSRPESERRSPSPLPIGTAGVRAFREPSVPSSDSKLTLDMKKITRIMAESHEVSVMLAVAMQVGSAEDASDPSNWGTPIEEEPDPPVPTETPSESSRAGDSAGSAIRTTLGDPKVEDAGYGVALPSEWGASSRDGVEAGPAARGPLGRFARFYEELVGAQAWDWDSAESLARRHGHMLSGAIEAINDWAFEAFGAPLVQDDGGQLLIDRDVFERTLR